MRRPPSRVIHESRFFVQPSRSFSRHRRSPTSPKKHTRYLPEHEVDARSASLRSEQQSLGSALVCESLFLFNKIKLRNQCIRTLIGHSSTQCQDISSNHFFADNFSLCRVIIKWGLPTCFWYLDLNISLFRHSFLIYRHKTAKL